MSKILTFHGSIDIFRTMTRDIVFKTSDDEEIQVTTYGNENLNSGRCLITVHGFKGFKDWGHGPYTAKYFSEKGFFVITFNFSHNGIGNNPIEFTELDKFAANTFSREIRELNEIIDAYKQGYFGNYIKGSIGLIGHSRGGAISILAAHNRNDIDAVVLWATVDSLDRYSERQKIQWRKKGIFEVLNMRTKQVMRLNSTLLDDLEQNKDDLLNIEKAVKDFNKPLLIVHGDQDLAVKKNEAEQLYEWSNKSKTEFFLISGAGHTFNMKHPFEGSNEKFERVLTKTLNFLQLSSNS